MALIENELTVRVLAYMTNGNDDNIASAGVSTLTVRMTYRK